MEIEIVEEQPPDWIAYGSIPISFVVRSVFDARPRDAAEFDLVERDVAVSWTKDYDMIAGDGPSRWRERFDVSRWGVLVARADGERAGGAVLVADTPGVEMLEGRSDLAVLWDLRIRPGLRGKGVGRALFRAAEAWARARGKAELKVETQNINVPACRFYARLGCQLRAVNANVYPELADEVQLLWYKRLTGQVAGQGAPGNAA